MGIQQTIFMTTENTKPDHVDYYFDGYLAQNMAVATRVIRKDWDMVFCIDGMEGTGKSVLAQQITKFCDPTLNIDRIVFTPREFRQAIMEAQPYQAVIYDEAYTGLNSRATMSMINRTLVTMLAEIRQKNLFVFVVMPTFFDLDKYVALWRSRALIHVYTGDNFKRGFFAFYNADKKKRLYIDGKKYYNYGQPRPNFVGRFINHYVVDETEYKKKKRSALMDREKKTEEAEKRRELDAELFQRVMAMPDTIPHNIKMELLAMPRATYFRKLKRFNDNNDGLN